MTNTKRGPAPLITLRDDGDSVSLRAEYPSQHFTSVHAKAYEIGALVYKEMAKLPRDKRAGLGFGFRVDLYSPSTDDTFVLRWEMAESTIRGFHQEREDKATVLRLAKMAEKMAKGLQRVSRGGGDIAWVSIPED